MDLAQYFNTMNTLKLKQIIKEEVEKALKEAPSSEFAPIESALNDFYDSYLAKDLRLSKEITPEERIERLQSFAGLLKSYISKLNSCIEEEEFWISKNQGLNEGYKLEDGEQKIIDDLFKQWKSGTMNSEEKEEWKEKLSNLSRPAKNKLNAMISYEREDSGLY